MLLYFLCMKQMGRHGFMRQLLRDSRVSKSITGENQVYVSLYAYACTFFWSVCVCVHRFVYQKLEIVCCRPPIQDEEADETFYKQQAVS